LKRVAKELGERMTDEELQGRRRAATVIDLFVTAGRWVAFLALACQLHTAGWATSMSTLCRMSLIMEAASLSQNAGLLELWFGQG